jgi:molybdate transport system ATP-binding protein
VLEIHARMPLREFALDVAITVEAGCVALAGPSGAGKTTVLRICAGLMRPVAGHVRCDGETWLDAAAGIDLPPERRSCGYVFQDYALFPHMTAWQNVAYGLRPAGRRERRARAEELLARFGAESLAAARPGELSGGERQRIALARALAPAPRALLLDEPLAALDGRTRAAATRELGTVLREAQVPAVLVTHDFAEAAHLGDEVAVMDRGQIVQRGPAEGLSTRPASAFVAEFAGASVLRGTARPGPGGLTAVDLDGGGTVVSTDWAEGRTAATVFPWEVTLEPGGGGEHGSAQNRLSVTVTSLARVGNRLRVGLAAPQPLSAEVTEPALRRLVLEPGSTVEAHWKATATRLTPL